MTKSPRRLRLPGVRLAVAEVARPLRRLRRVELVRRGTAAGNAAAAPAAAHRYALAGAAGAAQLYADIELEQHARLTTGIDEFDRVLGGGVVPGSLVLLGGEPGIGKSTLLLQAAANMARTIGPVLYSSGEESEHQIKSRGERLAVGNAPLYLLAETCLERILEEIARIKPALVIVDSVQTVFSLKFQSAPGSIGQVREAATQLLFTAKGQNMPTFLVGHVTKDGSLAGPKALEHVVDTVLYFEGERHHSHRVVRAVKNRFGAVSELGVFEMTSAGLRPVPNPSKMFLAERPSNAPGSAVLCSVEGSRPILVEVQALVSSSTYGTARRMASGIDQQRLSLLLAVLEKRAGLNLIGDDVFVNIAGGMTVDEPASDLGVLAAIASSVRNRVIPATTAMFGEVGLAGEVRGITQAALARARGRADGVPPLRHAGGEHRSDRRPRRRTATASWSASARSARRSTRCSDEAAGAALAVPQSRNPDDNCDIS